MTPALLSQDTLTGCLYGRNSNGVEKSIEDQIAEGRDDAESEGITIPDGYVYSDGVSASWYGKKSRDEWTRVLDDIEHRRWDVLFLWEASRGDRSPESWAHMIRRCREQGILIRIIRDAETLDPRKAGHLKRLLQDGLDSLFESVKISERVQKGIRGSMKRGTPLGRPMLGYTRTYEGGKLTGQVPNEAAGIVREIFARVARGVPVTHVRRWLEADGVATATGAKWSTSHVRDISRNVAYLGMRRGPDGALVEAGWEPIVSEDVFHTAQRVLDSRVRAGSRPGAQTALLSGIATCGVCGSVLRAGTRRGRRIYGCVSDAGCVAIGMADLDEVATDTITAIVARPDIHARLRKAGEVNDRDVQAARDEAARLTAKLDEARGAWQADRLSLESFIDMESRLKPLIKAANDRAESAGVDPALRQLVAPGADVEARWERMPLAARRDAIRALVSVVVQKARRVDGRYVPADERVVVALKGAE